MWNRIRFAFTFVVPFILLLVSGSGPVAAGNARAPTYTIIDLGTLSADSFSYGAAINARGQVVGGSTTAAGPLPHAFLWEAGTGMQDLDTLGCLLSTASGINARGQVVGFCTRSGADHAFLWEAGTGMQDLGTLGGPESSALVHRFISSATYSVRRRAAMRRDGRRAFGAAPEDRLW